MKNKNGRLRFLTGVNFDFTSPYPLHKCIHILESVSEKDKPERTPGALKIRIDSGSSKLVSFTVSKEIYMGRPSTATIQGVMQKEEVTHIHVNGKRAGKFGWALIFWFCLIGVTSGSSAGFAAQLAFPCLLFIALIYVNYEQSEMVKALYQLLSGEKLKQDALVRYQDEVD